MRQRVIVQLLPLITFGLMAEDLLMLLKSGEAHLEAEAMALRIAELAELDIAPFPYEDCRWLKREFDEKLTDFIPDLDLWFMKVAGYSRGGKRILSWPEEKVVQASGELSHSFFAEYPQYAWLERHITEANTRDLYEALHLSERLRKMLKELLSFMLREKYQEQTAIPR
jgi:hypothetical protein